MLRITRFDLGDSFDLALFGNRVASDHLQVRGMVSFGLEKKPELRTALAGTTGKLKMLRFNSMRFDGAQPLSDKGAPLAAVPIDRQGAVTGVTIALLGKPPFRLEFGALEKPLAQMRLCQQDLVDSWGYYHAEQMTLRAPPVPIGVAAWLSPDDYPIEALRQGQSGIVQYRLDVDAHGKAGGCYVLGRTSPTSLPT